MKVAHVVENLNRGGLERVLIELVVAQREAGYECAVACLFERGELAGELQDRGVAVHHFGKRTGVDVRALLRLRAWLRGQRGAIVHSHNATAHYHMVLAGAGMDFRRVVNTRHGMGGIDPHQRRERLFRRAMPRTDYVATVCDTVRRGLQEAQVAPRGGLVVVPNGIRIERLSEATDSARAELVAGLGFAPGTRLVGTVGRLDPVKNHALLLQAFAVVADRVPDAALLVIGDGPLRPELEAMATARGIAARVRFMGHSADVGSLLAGLAVYAQASRSEGYSLALLEACVAGLPVVATDVGGNREIVDDGRNGLLVASDDVGGLAAALSDLLRDPLRCNAMGEAGRRWGLVEASLATMVERYAALYAGVPFATAARPARQAGPRPPCAPHRVAHHGRGDAARQHAGESS